MNDELQMTNGERPIDEMQLPNRTSPTTTFDIQHSSFLPPSNQSGEGDIRQKFIEADREMLSGELRFPNGTSVTSTFALRPSNFAPALPGQIFSSRQITGCL